MTMKAIVNHTYGPPDVLRLDHVDMPTPADDQVLVRVEAAGVNRGDWHATTGLPAIVRVAEFGVRRPTVAVRGTDLAGTVTAVGRDVRRFQPGDAVVGWADGTFAEHAATSPDRLAMLPAHVSATQAAALPTTGVTALQAVRDVAGVKPGHRVLVVGASGGVGSFAVQIARALGAEVTGVTSTRNIELVRSLGATDVVDYTARDVVDGPERYDVVIDVAGAHGPAAWRRVLTPTGTLVLVGGPQGRWVGGMVRFVAALALSRVVSQRLVPLFSTSRAADLAELAELVSAGAVTPVVDRTVTLPETPDAIRRVGAGHTRGKVVVTI
jgi:NADPH:quinone reductase-like Zn-dependent oxidoreductase